MDPNPPRTSWIGCGIQWLACLLLFISAADVAFDLSMLRNQPMPSAEMIEGVMRVTFGVFAPIAALFCVGVWLKRRARLGK
jgi:hypothetical protein